MTKSLYTISLLAILAFNDDSLKNLDRGHGKNLIREINKEEKSYYKFTDYICKAGESCILLAYDDKEKREVAIKIALPQKPIWEYKRILGRKIRLVEAFDLFRKDKKDLGKRSPAAYRLIQSAYLQRELNEIFLAENKMVHGYIPAVHVISACPTKPYFSMEYIEGQDFLAWLQSKKVQEKVIFFLNLVQFFQEIHSKGIVHADIKPGNILVRNDLPVIIDFGIFKNVNESSNVTIHGEGMGTPLYRPPELRKGQESHKRDFRVDIFELGRLFWVLWTGAKPQTNWIVDILKVDFSKLFPIKVFGSNSYARNIFINATDNEKERRYQDITEMEKAIIELNKSLQEIPDILNLCKNCLHKNKLCANFRICEIRSKLILGKEK